MQPLVTLVIVIVTTVVVLIVTDHPSARMRKMDAPQPVYDPLAQTKIIETTESSNPMPSSNSPQAIPPHWPSNNPMPSSNSPQEGTQNMIIGDECDMALETKNRAEAFERAKTAQAETNRSARCPLPKVFMQAESLPGQLAFYESLGYIRDTDCEWQRRATRHYNQVAKQKFPCCYENRPGNNYFQRNYEPTISCRNSVRVGERGDGGKWICNPHPRPGCLIYSIGSSVKTGFESDIYKLMGCEIHVFDHTQDGHFIKKDERWHTHFHQWGIAGRDYETTSPKGKKWEFKSIPTILKLLNHTERVIDIFKIDCEGCEYETLNPILDRCEMQNIRMFNIEMHFRKTTDAAEKENDDFLRLMEKNNFAIHYKEPNTEGGNHGHLIEYAFIRTMF